MVTAVNLLKSLFLRIHVPMSFTTGLDPHAAEHAGFIVVDVIGRRTKDGVKTAVDDIVDCRVDEPISRRGATRAWQDDE